MGAAFEVYNVIGPGLAEEVYQESLEIELELREVDFRSKVELNGFYKGRTLQRRYVPDLVVAGGVVVELKAAAALASEHEAQLFNYLHLARARVGYLINFGHPGTLQWRRYIVTPKVWDQCR